VESGPLAYERAQQEFLDSLQNPSHPPPLQNFRALREHYLRTFNAVMERHRLDALAFPQALSESPLLASDQNILPTSVSSINIAGLPLISVPAGDYASGTPFGIVIIGRLWSEAELLGLAYDWERHVHARTVPNLIAGSAEGFHELTPPGAGH
jgi:Asp-tRNA(Asn)/Glu-tRNA(Gln) amidotransferase A subunit family amidase